MELVERPGAGVWLAAARPRFLTVILIPAMLGAVLAQWRIGQLDHWLLLATLLAAALAQAGANVLNDYFDHLSGADALNTEPLSPFAGGSRMIQNGLLSPTQTRRLGFGLLAAAAAIGLVLCLRAGPGLLLIGAFGLALGYAYTAPPVCLCYRGLGEGAILLAFGPLPVAGGYLVQTGQFDAVVWLPGLALGALAAAILYVNQFPDCDADGLAGKRTLVVQLGARIAAGWYWVWPGLAGLMLVATVALGQAPPLALAALLPLGLTLKAGRTLADAVQGRADMRGAIKPTIAAHALVGLVLVVVFATGAAPPG